MLSLTGFLRDVFRYFRVFGLLWLFSRWVLRGISGSGVSVMVGLKFRARVPRGVEGDARESSEGMSFTV